MTNYIVGAYAASPCLNEWVPDREASFLKKIAEMPSVLGLEIPFYRHLHKFDEEFLFRHLNPAWMNIVSDIPGTMDRLKLDPAFGLASPSEFGRKAAVDYAESMRQSINRLNTFMKKRSVLAVEIHSSPVKSSKQAFAESLREIASWDWFGAELVVEHCDAWRLGQNPSKGFLSLDEEIETLRSLGETKTPLGILINWGRSAIEGRNPSLPLTHIKQAVSARLLKGIIFSGCAAEGPAYGGWVDAHAPFSASEGISGDPHSLLTKKRAMECLDAAGVDRLPIIGFKFQPLPAEKTLDQRIHLVKESLEILNDCVLQKN